MQDFGEILLRTNDVTGYIRVDWFTPDGLPTWGDGRLFIIGTEGTIELRKYVDIGGAPGGDHLMLVDRQGRAAHRLLAMSQLPYGRALVHDILDRTETAMPQARCFKAMELALTAAGRWPSRGADDAGENEQKIWNVGVVGCGIGRSHIVEGYARHAGQVPRCWRSAISTRSGCKAVGDEFDVARRTALVRRAAGDAAISTLSTSARRRRCTCRNRSRR